MVVGGGWVGRGVGSHTAHANCTVGETDRQTGKQTDRIGSTGFGFLVKNLGDLFSTSLLELSSTCSVLKADLDGTWKKCVKLCYESNLA